MKSVGIVTALLALVAFATAPAAAEEASDETADLAKAAQNPVANLISLPFQNNTNFEFGPREKTQNVLNIQPVLPFSLNQDWNLITRTILPISSQPSLFPGQDRETGLGDTTFTAFLSPVAPFKGKLTWGAGPVFLLPTATDDRLGADKWGLGPSLVVLTMPGNWVIGSLFSNVWSVGGSGDDDVNVFSWQYFVNYNLPDGWYLTSAPIMTANWEADRSSDTWTSASMEPISLDRPIGEDEDSNLSDFIEDTSAASPAQTAAHAMLREQLTKVLSTLTRREEKVIRLRFGLGDGTPRTLEEVGTIFNVTRERVRQIEAKALKKLQHPSRARKLKGYTDIV